MYVACKKCKYNYNGECDFYYMGSGNEIDMPCYREKELIKEAADNFCKAFVQYCHTPEQLENISTIAKNDLEVDVVSRKAVIEMVNAKNGYVCPADVLELPTARPNICDTNPFGDSRFSG